MKGKPASKVADKGYAADRARIGRGAAKAKLQKATNKKVK